MEITGWQKTSLIDYPEKISTVVFTQGCNFRCPYCHNPELIPFTTERPLLDLKYFWQFLEERSSFLDGVVITGGEPLLQKDLLKFAGEVKARDYSVKVDTNGSRPDLIKEMIKEDLVDYMALDVKSPPAKYDLFVNYEEIAGAVRKSIYHLVNSGIKYELRTTVVPGLHAREDIEKISRLIQDSSNYFLQNFRSGETYDPEYGDKQRFSEESLHSFKKIAEKFVDNVFIRD